MTDVLKLAIDRREKLQQEVAKLDEFIRMAHSLLRGAQATPASAESDTTGSRETLTRRAPGSAA